MTQIVQPKHPLIKFETSGYLSQLANIGIVFFTPPLAPHLDHPFLILIWHLLVGYLFTVSFSWGWIPLTKEEKQRGPSLDHIRGKIFGQKNKKAKYTSIFLR